MSEHREHKFANEFRPFYGHHTPNINRALVQLIEATYNDTYIRESSVLHIRSGRF